MTPTTLEPTAGPAFANPHDTVASSATRFLAEVVAWTAGPLAVHQVSGSVPLAGLALLGLVAAPALCNAPGDKHHEGPLVTPGPARFALELGLGAVAVVGAAVVAPAPLAIAVLGMVALGAVAGAPRARWLLAGAPRPAPRPAVEPASIVAADGR